MAFYGKTFVFVTRLSKCGFQFIGQYVGYQLSNIKKISLIALGKKFHISASLILIKLIISRYRETGNCWGERGGMGSNLHWL